MVSSVVQSCPTFCDPRNCSTAGFSVHHQLTELAQTHVHWVGDAIQSSYPLWSLQSFPASGSFPIRWPKYCSRSFSISPSNEYLGLISFKIDWFDLLTVEVKIEIHEDVTQSAMRSHCHHVFVLLIGMILNLYINDGINLRIHEFRFIKFKSSIFCPS